MVGTTALSDQDLQLMMDLIKGADSVELKLTIHESARADAARARRATRSSSSARSSRITCPRTCAP